MSYSTKEVTDKLNISKHTLRYYEKEGILTPIAHDEYMITTAQVYKAG